MPTTNNPTPQDIKLSKMGMICIRYLLGQHPASAQHAGRPVSSALATRVLAHAWEGF